MTSLLIFDASNSNAYISIITSTSLCTHLFFAASKLYDLGLGLSYLFMSRIGQQVYFVSVYMYKLRSILFKFVEVPQIWTPA